MIAASRGLSLSTAQNIYSIKIVWLYDTDENDKQPAKFSVYFNSFIVWDAVLCFMQEALEIAAVGTDSNSQVKRIDLVRLFIVFCLFATLNVMCRILLIQFTLSIN